MMSFCLPWFRSALRIFGRFQTQESPAQDHEQSPTLVHSYSTFPAVQQHSPGNPDYERRRSAVDAATIKHVFSPTATDPVASANDHGFAPDISHTHPNLSSSTYLAPPSPIRPRSRSSNSDLESIVSEESFLETSASSFSTEGFSNTPDLDSRSQLEDALDNALLEWPEDSNHHFLPVNDIKSLVTMESIEVQLDCHHVKPPPGQTSRGFAQRILQFSQKLFCILILIQKTQSIVDFVEENLTDLDLPYIRQIRVRRSGRFRLCSQQNPAQPIKAMEKWSFKSLQDFSLKQWCVLSPVFMKSDSIEHYTFDYNSILPYLRDEEHNHSRAGGGGKVWEIVIHPEHQFFHCKILNPSFALKKLHSSERSFFDSEVEMYKSFNNRERRHEHLIKLLATYEFKGGFYLLFPWAKANLREYWTQKPVPEFSEATIKWILRQCKGIASGLLRIHGYQTTMEALEDSQVSAYPMNNAEHDSVGHNTRLYNCHGDIKPENILWSDDPSFKEQGILLISDFGSMKGHKEKTVFRQTPEEARGSAQYEPPEVAGYRATKPISRAYDIWSLGCVYLEMVTWFLVNAGGLKAFEKNRSGEGNDGAFFTFTNHGLAGRQDEAIVKESVKEWINQLKCSPRCSDFIHDLLDLISHHMLIKDPNSRIRCGLLNESLNEMVKKADRNSKYLVTRSPQSISGEHAEAASQGQKTGHLLSGSFDGEPLPKRPSVAKNP